MEIRILKQSDTISLFSFTGTKLRGTIRKTDKGFYICRYDHNRGYNVDNIGGQQLILKHIYNQYQRELRDNYIDSKQYEKSRSKNYNPIKH